MIPNLVLLCKNCSSCAAFYSCSGSMTFQKRIRLRENYNDVDNKAATRLSVLLCACLRYSAKNEQMCPSLERKF